MKTRLKFVVYLFTFSFLIIFSTISEVNAQDETSGYITCDSNCNTTPYPDCQDGYRLPDLCIGQEGNCCRVLAQNGIGGSCDPITGVCTCSSGPSDYFRNCIEDTSTPTPAPECEPDWTCIQAGTAAVCDSLSIGSEFTPCYISPGINGDCCRSPDQPLNPCITNGGYCLSPADQSTPGNCEWNQIDLGMGLYCTNAGFPEGTLCCDSVAPGTCSTVGGTGGVCRESCQVNETPYSGITDCNNPSLFPPNGGECCLESSNSQYNQKLFCDDNGNPTKSMTGRIYTAIGCVPVGDTNSLTRYLLTWGLGIGGGIAFVLIVYAGLMIMTSSGNPQRLQAGKELLSSAVAGLLLMAFSVFILRLIGVDILRIPGL
jgi:hypothetical protein